ncbi:MAG: tetratricopeptide repeat protein [Planctomycetes bacterium]|nr:tetratricopeptide repeat protein [Planctomycetota bacterium]
MSDDSSTAWSLRGIHVAFLGRLGGWTRREIPAWVREHGGVLCDPHDARTQLVVIGADEIPVGRGALLDAQLEERAARGELEIVSETELWQRLGMIDESHDVRRLYTPAMLAQWFGVKLSTIRRWWRRGLIVPAREVHRLPYFDFQEVATARRLAELVAAGVSPAEIERQLRELARWVPGVQRPLAQLSVIVEGRDLLVRHEEGLLEPGGQRRFDFAAGERQSHRADFSREPPRGVEVERTPGDGGSAGRSADQAASDGSIGIARDGPPSPAKLVDLAHLLEDRGELPEAAEMLRAAMAAGGPRAELCFQLAEILYRLGDLSGARERYFVALELDEDYVEARANLGCLLLELGDTEHALAAFQGALDSHPDFPDVHYHLARLLDDRRETAAAEAHWRSFLRLAPESPWGHEARRRLGLSE